MEKIPFWSWPLEKLLTELKCQKEGLSSPEADSRLKTYGPNSLKPPTKGKGITLLLAQFKSPLILLLIGAALLSFFVGGKTDATLIFIIVFLSGLLGFFQERGAINSLEKLMQLVENKTVVLRDGKECEIPFHEVVPGDVLVLSAGDLVPADCAILEAKHLFADEATMTGESSPVEKAVGIAAAEAPLIQRSNALFKGTMVASGSVRALVVLTGKNTEYSSIVDTLRFRPPETAFEIGVRKFGYLLLEITMVLLIIIFAVNIYLHRPVIESLLFALALAVGLTPQLLPAIISVNLSHGARRMAKKRVIVKRLPSIENFGQMDILCADKTGTLTVGKIKLEQSVGTEGQKSEKTAFYGFLNAHFQAGYSNPLDLAIQQAGKFDVKDWKKVDEIPYDFNRKRLSVILEHDNRKIIIAKGALPQILSVCNRVEFADGKTVPLEVEQKNVEKYFDEQSEKGFRTLALAYGDGEEEKNLIFLGFLHFMDPIKPDIAQVANMLFKKGVALKIITGDHHAVAAHVAAILGVTQTSIITGAELHQVNDQALLTIVQEKTVFAEIEPNQKARIILALRKSGHVVGYLGDGINDVSALHSADIGIAVDSGADAAKAASDIVLLEKDLNVLSEGILEGRRTFINTMKYVYMASSANLGNMFSMAGASLFLPFLPLLPKQVLLTNFFSDLPEMALATDRVSPSTVLKPVKWDLALIRKFMIVFGVLNSFADFLTFGVLLIYFKANEQLFHSGWFIENVVSAALVVLAIRTRGSIFHSKPGRLLALAIFVVAVGVPFLPYTPLGKVFELVPVPLSFYGILTGIIMFYISAVEIAKHFFFKSRYS
jgi:Mg2+-importing ATPase